MHTFAHLQLLSIHGVINGAQVRSRIWHTLNYERDMHARDAEKHCAKAEASDVSLCATPIKQYQLKTVQAIPAEDCSNTEINSA